MTIDKDNATPPHHRSDGRFRNPWIDARGSRTRGLLRWLFIERPSKRLPKDPDPASFPLAEPGFATPNADPGELTVTWIGHATTLLQIGRYNVLTDPMWSDRAFPVQFAGPRRWVPPGVPWNDLPRIDVVVQSHNHYDHLDDRTVRALVRDHPEAHWCVPLGLGSFFSDRGAARVHELDWWQERSVAGLGVACTPAQHFSARTLTDRNRTLWSGWALWTDDRRVFFAGDTGHHPRFAEIGQRYGPFDVALMPVGAYEPRWFMRTVHMDPEEAVRAFGELGSGSAGHDGSRRIMVPIHFGTFKLTDEAMDEPPRRTREAWRRAGLPAEDLWLLAHGETRTLVL